MRIAYDIRNQGGLYAQDQWDTLRYAMIEAMTRLEKALKPYPVQVR